jgi:hypothetical protein
MNKYITFSRLDETIALSVVKPLDGSLCHLNLPKQKSEMNRPREKPLGEQTIKRRKPGETWDASLFYEPNNEPLENRRATRLKRKLAKCTRICVPVPAFSRPFALKQRPPAAGR